MNTFTEIYFIAIVVEILIRAPFTSKRKAEKISERHITAQENILVGLLTIGTLVFPVIYAATNWLKFANYTLPAWASWVGVTVLASALFIFWRSHVDLGLNWSPSLEIREKHELITRGIYSVIRHPMYASQWLWGIAQMLLLQNWLAGFLNLVISILFYFLRVRAEEKMMLDSFGEQYHEYMGKVGGVVPKFGRG